MVDLIETLPCPPDDELNRRKDVAAKEEVTETTPAAEKSATTGETYSSRQLVIGFSPTLWLAEVADEFAMDSGSEGATEGKDDDTRDHKEKSEDAKTGSEEAAETGESSGTRPVAASQAPGGRVLRTRNRTKVEQQQE